MTVPIAPSAPVTLLAALARGLSGVAVVAMLLLSAALIVPSLLGYERYVLTGASMEPTIKQGSIVYAEIVPVDALRPRDIMTFVPPGRRSPTTHRITAIEQVRGARVFRTKGDANAGPDPWRITLPQGTQARMVASVPYVGWAFIALGAPDARRWLLGLPAILIAMFIVVRTWRHAGALTAEAPLNLATPSAGEPDSPGDQHSIERPARQAAPASPSSEQSVCFAETSPHQKSLPVF